MIADWRNLTPPPETRGAGDVAPLGAAWGAPALAQCRPPANSNEARLLAFYEAPIVFSMADAPEKLASGAVRVDAEGAPSRRPMRRCSARASATRARRRARA